MAGETFFAQTDGGIAATHPPQQIQSALVGSSTGLELNVIQEDLRPIACTQLKDARFAFDSSFIGPQIATEMQLLARLRSQIPDAPLSIFAHADPIGDDAYNKTLSGRRAQAVYALLTRRTDLWDELYKSPFGGDQWGYKSIQVMLATLGHYDGPIDGIPTLASQQAVKAFQASPEGAGSGTPDGDPGKDTRPLLFKAYMDAICIDDGSQPFQLDPAKDFLGAGADEGGKGDYQGCSEFNPVLLFSKDEEAAFRAAPDKTERNKENEPNRRVLIFLFRPGTIISLDRWPCPRAKEGVAACKKRFFTDAEQRLARGPDRRKYQDTQDTFACRFYDRFAAPSPCETGLITTQVQLLDPFGNPMVLAPFRFSSPELTLEGNTDSFGFARFRSASLPVEGDMEWGTPVDDADGATLQYARHLILQLGDDPVEADLQRLRNLGYSNQVTEDNVRRFQRDHGLPDTGQLSDISGDLQIIHDRTVPRPFGETIDRTDADRGPG